MFCIAVETSECLDLYPGSMSHSGFLPSTSLEVASAIQAAGALLFMRDIPLQVLDPGFSLV